MKSVVYHRLAESEMVGSAIYYERRRNFLGERFLDGIEVTLAKIQTNPALGRRGPLGTKSRKVKRFPLRIIYLEETERIWIVAVAHLSRKPDYWHERMN